MRIANPFIMITHVIGSLRVIHDFRPCSLGLRTPFASLRNRRGGDVRPRERRNPGSVAHSAGIDRRIVQSTSVRRAPRDFNGGVRHGDHHYDSLKRRNREAHLGAQSTDTIKLNFINWILKSISVGPLEREGADK